MRPFSIGLMVAVILVVPALAAMAEGPAWEPVGLGGQGAMFEPAVSPVDGKLAIVHCDMSAAYITRDGGASWRMIDTAQLRSNTRCRAAFSPTDGKTIYSPNGWGTLSISTDAGEHWKTLATFGDELNGPIVVSPNSSCIVVGTGEKVQLSRDGGKTFKECAGIQGELMGAHFGLSAATNEMHVFIATKSGVWQGGWTEFTSGGLHAVGHSTKDDQWTDLGTGLPGKEIQGFSGGTTQSGQTTLYCTVAGHAAKPGGPYVGGIYRWRTGEKEWENINGTGLNLETKAFDEWAEGPIAQYYDIGTTDKQPDTVWVSNSNTGIPPPHQASVYRSDDGGKTWRATFYPDPRYPGWNVEKDYMVAEDGQFYQGIGQIAVDGGNPDHVLQIVGGECYYTNDGGKSWKCGHTQCAGTPERGAAWKCTGLVVTTTWHYYIDPHETDRHYICYTDIGFARSLDAGKTWMSWAASRPGHSSSPWRNTCYELAFDPDKSGRMWGAFSEVHDIPNANIIHNRHRATGPGGICVSDDFAATWQPLAGGLPKAPATGIVVDPKSSKDARTLYAGFFGEGVFKSTDGGQTWKAANHGLGAPANMRVDRLELHPDGTLFAMITALVKGRQYQEEGVGLYRSADSGDSWQCITRTAPCLWPKDFTVDPSDSKTIYMGLCDGNGKKVGGLYRTTDGGASWQMIFRAGNEHFGAYLNPKHPGWIYATLCEDAPKYGLYLSKDNGKSFSPMAGMPFDNAMRVTCDPGNENVIYVSTFGGSVWRGPAE